MLNISAAATAADLPSKTVRYYADIDLVPAASRSGSGYRLYDDASVKRLIFVRRSRAFGFSIEECRELLDLYNDDQRPSSEVKRIASQKLQEIRKKQAELQSLHDELSHLVETCAGDHRPDCPILDYLG
jgi:Cu(I)-responsive transcriptional regulator